MCLAHMGSRPSSPTMARASRMAYLQVWAVCVGGYSSAGEGPGWGHQIGLSFFWGWRVNTADIDSFSSGPFDISMCCVARERATKQHHLPQKTPPQTRIHNIVPSQHTMWKPCRYGGTTACLRRIIHAYPPSLMNAPCGDHAGMVVRPLAEPAPVVADQVEVEVVRRRRGLAALDLLQSLLAHEEGGATWVGSEERGQGGAGGSVRLRIPCRTFPSTWKQPGQYGKGG